MVRALPPVLAFLLLLAIAGLTVPAAAQDYDLATSGDVLMQADLLTYDDETGVVTAEGNVELAYGERVLLADKLTYDETTGVVTAEGNISLIEPNGDVLFADYVRLEDELQQGVAETLSVLLTDDTRVAALDGYRTDRNTTVFRKGVFSPCQVCEDGSREPLWQIKAFRVIHDREGQRIIYEDAFMEFFGIPVLYVPIFFHSDPTVERQSGFLGPRLRFSDDLGTTFIIPYYWAISDQMDATIRPWYTTQQGFVGELEFRHHVGYGTYELDLYGTFPEETDSTGPGSSDFRGAAFGEGEFTINPRWTTGFELETTTDDTFLRRYDISNENDLLTHGYVQRIDGLDFFDVSAFYFTGLLSGDRRETTPLIAPLVEYHNVLDQDWVGGELSFDANLLSLTREEGADSHRLSAKLEWDAPYVTSTGEIYRLFANLRSDVYHTRDVPNPGAPGTAFDDETIARVLPTAGAEWRWPFVRSGEGSTQQVVEPIVQLIYAPNSENPPEIPNEDSLTFEFDDTNLFAENRFPGLDRWEGGARANVGVQYSIYGRDGGYAQAMVGQTFRAEEDDTFAAGSGLDDHVSDYVGRITVEPNANFSLSHRFRIDREEFDFARNEVDVQAQYGPLSASLGYVFLDESTSQALGVREEAVINARYRFAEYWSLYGGWRRDIEESRTVDNLIGIAYQDECFGIALGFKQEFTRDRDIEPETSIGLSINLKHLGAFGFDSGQLETQQ